MKKNMKEKKNIYICITESLYNAADSNTLQINCMSIKKKI